MIRKPKKLPRWLTADEMASLFALCDVATPIGLRNLCMMRLMADCGLRDAEMLSIKEEDVNWDESSEEYGDCIVWGKGSKERQITINNELMKLLARWRSLRPRYGKTLMCTLEGTHTADRYVREMMARLGKKAGIVPCHPHMLRHTFATDALNKGCSIKLVQEMLGHADISTTARYLHVTSKEKKNAFRTLRD